MHNGLFWIINEEAHIGFVIKFIVNFHICIASPCHIVYAIVSTDLDGAIFSA